MRTGLDEEVFLFHPKYNSVMLHRFWFDQVGIYQYVYIYTHLHTYTS